MRVNSILFSILLLLGNLAFGQPKDSLVSNFREKARNEIETIREELRAYPNTGQVDTFKMYLSDVISICKTLRNEKSFNYISLYFKRVSETLRAKDRGNNSQLFKYLNSDLSLKLNYTQDTILGWESETFFGKYCNVKVRVFMNDTLQIRGFYRLHYLSFLGEDIEKILKRREDEGSSNEFSNPYIVSLSLPGLYTFWLQDVRKDLLYKPDFIYKELSPEKLTLDIYFTRFP